jgi:dihydroorotate dehydrogenase (NAD+) catalytic subunit
VKRDLFFRAPLMNAAGTLGFAPDPRSPAPWTGFGAFVTNPLSLRPRRPTARPDRVEYPGGILLHTGLPNPGFTAAVKMHAARWARSDLPVIVHLMADRPEETARMVKSLESRDNVMAAELGFAPLLADDILLVTLEMCLGELPLIFCLPPEQVLTLGPRLVQAGASAVSLAPPRGAIPAAPPPQDATRSSGGRGEPITGRLYGPGLFPQSLARVREAARLGLPVIGAGGVWTKADTRAMLDAGALAVQVDAALWGLGADAFSAP